LIVPCLPSHRLDQLPTAEGVAYIRLHPQARYPELARGAAYRMLCNVIDKIRVDLVKLTIEGIWPRWQHIAGGTTGLPSAPNGGKR
jgi:hypothetical protein